MKHSLAKVSVVSTTGTGTEATKRTVRKVLDEDATKGQGFFVVDCGDIYRKHRQWLRMLPRVEPFYAMKCNSDPVIMKATVAMGLSYDCASRAEIEAVLALGVSPECIIFANPCKPIEHIKYAREVGVEMMTFDNEEEIRKVRVHHPTAKLVLRVLADDSKSICRLGLKFGAAPETTYDLLAAAKTLDANVIGVSFHVGSGCRDATAFSDAVSRARKVFDEGASLGFAFTLLDVGGGFPGSEPCAVSFKDITNELNTALDRHFPPSMGVRIIGEPGRYYVSSCATLALQVTSKRVVKREGDQGPAFMYYINDGVYGAFNCILFDHALPVAQTLNKPKDDTHYETSFWGPTCDSMDCVVPSCKFPEMYVGDWVIFEDMGAYTSAASTTFNGFPRSIPIYTFTATERFDERDLPEKFPIYPSALPVQPILFA